MGGIELPDLNDIECLLDYKKKEPAINEPVEWKNIKVN